MSGNDDRRASRRSVLKTTGFALASTATAAGTVSASLSSRGVNQYQKSLELRNKYDWNVDMWHEYLESVGFEVSWEKATVNYSRRPTTQKLDRHESEFTYTYTSDICSGYDAADIDWNHKAGDLDDFGENPVDTASIAFSSDHYDRTYDVDDWVYYGDDAEDPDGFDSKDPNNGAAAVFHDGRLPDDNDGHFGVYLEPTSDSSSSERELEFDYVHTWSKGELDSLSIGTGGISFGFTQTTERWDYEESFLESDLTDGEHRDPGKT